MKFMEKAKRFFTLSAKHEGFTLVELIVVIAILAILAGVAIPAYSGYIKKAQEAGDQTLLAAVNKAFAAACLENGTDALQLQDGAADIDLERVGEDYKVVGVKPEALEVDFFDYFAGNEDSTFKTISDLVFVDGVFVDIAKAGTVTKTFFGKDYTFNLHSVNAIQGSVFADNVPAMQGQLTGISTAFGDFVGSVDTAGSISPAFKEFMDKNGYGDEDLGNAAVLYVAGEAGNYNAQDIAQMFQDIANAKPNNMQDVLNTFEGEDALTNIALMYGAATAYANSTEGKKANPGLADQLKDVNDGNSLLAAFNTLQNNPNWSNYLGNEEGGVVTPSEQFTADMNGFLGAMDAINTVSPDVKTDDANFWNSDEVNALLGDLGFK